MKNYASTFKNIEKSEKRQEIFTLISQEIFTLISQEILKTREFENCSQNGFLYAMTWLKGFLEYTEKSMVTATIILLDFLHSDTFW